MQAMDDTVRYGTLPVASLSALEALGDSRYEIDDGDVRCHDVPDELHRHGRANLRIAR